MVDTAIITGVKNYLKAISNAGISIECGVIFGSYTCGSATSLSDIDVLVISPDFDGVVPREILQTLWRIAAKTDSRIEPIPCGQRQGENDHSNEIIETARSTGQKVFVN